MSEQAAILVSVCVILYFPCDTDFWQCQDGCGWISCCDCCKAPDFMGGGSVYAVSTVLSNEIWFVLGINICAFDIRLKGKKLQGMVCGLLFVILSVIVYVTDIHSSAVSFAMGLLACTAVILLVAGFEDKCSRGMSFLAKYTMPIFLMHTLFAAPLRSVLLKVGITNAECGSSCGNRTGYQFCGTCRCGMDYETNKVARVLSVSE